MLAPTASKAENEKAVVLQLIWVLLFWPLGIIAQPARLPEHIEWWTERARGAKGRGLKQWQAALLLVALPFCLLGILDGHGDLGSLWVSLAVITATVGNLVLWAQIVKFTGMM